MSRQDHYSFGYLPMLHMEFTEEERKTLHFERFHHPHPRVQQKMEAVLLKSHDLSHAMIACILQINEGTLLSYLRAYQEGGIEKLKTIPWHGTESELSQHQGTLKDFFCNIRRPLRLRLRKKSPN